MAAVPNEVVQDVETEKQHFQDVFESFAFYREYATRRLNKVEQNASALPVHHLAMLQPDFGERLGMLRTAVDVNYSFVREMLQSSRDIFVNSSVSREDPMDGSTDVPTGCASSGGASQGADLRGNQAAPAVRTAAVQEEGATSFNMDKVITTLRQFYRDWSKEGQPERDACYRPLFSELLKCCPLPREGYQPPRVLVPGAGLGRLAFDIAQQGYECQGNEFSMHMLMASNFILNRPADSPQLTLHPFVLQFCNNLSSSDQLQQVLIPDACPAAIGCKAGNFSMSAGDFLDVYTEPDQWDCVVTCFFLDTAHNPLAYIECIEKILVPGGHWLNLGPLLWHWSDIDGEKSIELSYEQLRRVIVGNFQFTMLKEESNHRGGYIQNPRSMMKTVYDSVLFVARKSTSAGAMHPGQTVASAQKLRGRRS